MFAEAARRAERGEDPGLLHEYSVRHCTPLIAESDASRPWTDPSFDFGSDAPTAGFAPHALSVRPGLEPRGARALVRIGHQAWERPRRGGGGRARAVGRRLKRRIRRRVEMRCPPRRQPTTRRTSACTRARHTLDLAAATPACSSGPETPSAEHVTFRRRTRWATTSGNLLTGASARTSPDSPSSSSFRIRDTIVCSARGTASPTTIGALGAPGSSWQAGRCDSGPPRSRAMRDSISGRRTASDGPQERGAAVERAAHGCATPCQGRRAATGLDGFRPPVFESAFSCGKK